MANKLLEIIHKCKCGVYLTINQHKDFYQDVQTYIDRVEELNEGTKDEIGKETIDKMIEYDKIIELQFYPHTPGGFYKLWSYDLDLILCKALNILENEIDD